MPLVDALAYSISGNQHRNSWRGLSLFVAVVSLASDGACGTRAVKPSSAVDAGTGGLTGSGGGVGTGGLTGSGGGVGTGGLTGSGGAVGTAGSTGTGGNGDGGRIGTGGTTSSDGGDASVDSTTDGARDGGLDGAALCSSIGTEYAAALHAAQECNVGAAHQCEIQARAGFFCNCTTFVNSGADGLAAIVTSYDSNGCKIVCGGICVQPQALTCLSDATSRTGGRCKVPGQLALTAASNGGSFSVDVGSEVDVTLESTTPGSYSTDIAMSSDIMTVLEITIPASAPNLNGPPRLYRLRARSAGQVEIQIPFEAALPGGSRPAYKVTIAVR